MSKSSYIMDKETQTAFKLVSNAKRFAILKLIFKSKKELCVGEIAVAVEMTQSAVSHQLAKLDAYGVIYGKRVGQTICYMKKDTSISKKINKLINLF